MHNQQPLESLLTQYQSKCESVFKDLNSDKEFPRALETGGIFRFDKYSLDLLPAEGSSGGYDQAQAAQAAIDFITGLR